MRNEGQVKYGWTNRLTPPLLLAVVVACVWYALDGRPSSMASTPPVQAKIPTMPVAQTATAHAEATAPPSPTVKKLGSQLEFSVAAVPYKDVQRVEFYVEKQFVGAAYSQPYSVAISENTLVAGTHTITAKIYTTTDTAESSPATFTATPTAPSAAAIDTPNTTDAPVIPTGTSNTSAQAPAAPTDVAASAAADGTSTTLSWTAVAGATHYYVWRDGVQVGTTTGAGYTDTGLAQGHTYDYQVLSVDDASNASTPSTPVAITMPTPPDTSPVNNTGNSSASSSAPANDQDNTDKPGT